MHPYPLEHLTRTRLAEFADEAARARLAAASPRRLSRRRGLGLPDRIGRKIDRRRLRDLAY